MGLVARIINNFQLKLVISCLLQALLSTATFEGDEISLEWENAVQPNSAAVQICPSAGESRDQVGTTAPILLDSNGNLMLQFHISTNDQFPPISLRYKVYPRDHDSTLSKPLQSCKPSGSGSTPPSFQFQEIDWSTQPERGPKAGLNLVLISLPCESNYFVLEARMQQQPSIKQSSCATIDQVKFSLSGTVCKPKFFPKRLTFLPLTFSEGFRSEECIPNAQVAQPRTSFEANRKPSPDFKYKCFRKFSLLGFEFYPVDETSQGSEPGSNRGGREFESSNVGECVCSAGFENFTNFEGSSTCRPCGPNSFKTFPGSASCSFCPPNSRASDDRKGCVCDPGFFPESSTVMSTSLASGGLGKSSMVVKSCAAVPSPVRQLSSYVSGDVVFVYWRPPSNLNELQIKQTTFIISLYNSTNNRLLGNYSTRFQSKLLTGLEAKANYLIKVYASYKSQLSAPQEVSVSTSEPWAVNFTKESAKQRGSVVLKWSDYPARSVKNFVHYNIQVLPKQLSHPSKNNRFLLVLDAEVTTNVFTFNADNIKPIYGSYWDEQQGKYVEYGPVSTEYCVRVGIVETFSNPFLSSSSLSSNSPSAAPSSLYTHWSTKCEPVQIGGFVFAKVIIWGCVFVLFIVVLLLCLIVGCCFVKYKRRQFEALYPHHNTNTTVAAAAIDPRYAASEYIVAAGHYPPHVQSFPTDSTYIPVGSATSYWSASAAPGTTSPDILYHPATAILPPSRTPLGIDNEVYEVLNQHKYNMGMGLQGAGGMMKGQQQSLTPDYVGLHHHMNNSNMSDLENDIYQMQKGFDCSGNILGMTNFHQSGKLGSEVNFDVEDKESSSVGSGNRGQGHQTSKGHNKPPLPSRCPAGDNMQSGGGNSTISSTNSNGSGDVENPYKPSNQSAEHFSQPQATINPANQGAVVPPPRPVKTPPSLVNRTGGGNKPNFSPHKSQSIYEDLDNSKNSSIYISNDTRSKMC